MSSELKGRVGARVRALRKRAGVSRERLAGQAEVDGTYLGGIERGEHNPSIEVLERLAAALDVPVAVLVDDLAELDVEALRDAVARRAERLDRDELLALVRIMDALRWGA